MNRSVQLLSIRESDRELLMHLEINKNMIEEANRISPQDPDDEETLEGDMPGS